MSRVSRAVVVLALALALPAVAPLAAQQSPIIAVEDLLLAADRMRADRWYPEERGAGDAQAGRHNRAADLDLLVLASKHPQTNLRYFAVREFGRFETPENVTFLATFLDDSAPVVRVAAADALVQSLIDHPEARAEATFAIAAIEERLKREVLSPTRGDLWIRLAELPLPASVAKRYEREWIAEIQQMRDRRFDAAEALVRLFRTDGTRRADPSSEDAVLAWTRAGLQQRDSGNVRVGFEIRGSVIQFLRILEGMRANNDAIAIDAARFTCAAFGSPCGDDIREFGVRALNPHNATHLFPLELSAKDRSFLTAANMAVRKLIQAPDVPLCRVLALADGLPSELDVIDALGTAKPERFKDCGEWDPTLYLQVEAQVLAAVSKFPDWVVPMSALEAFARRLVADKGKGERLETLRRLNTEVASRHLQWQVRAASARVAALIDDVALLAQLVTDEHPNVLTEVIRSLVALKNPMVYGVALEALEFSDPQLLITAANALAGIPQPEAARAPLFDALERLTFEESDTSRRARMALIERIAAVIAPQAPDADVWVSRLRAYQSDFDPPVAEAVAKAIGTITGTPGLARPTRRPGHQPSATALTSIPPCISLQVEGATREFVVVFDRLLAPIAIARVMGMLGTWQGTTLHRVNENIAIGGSIAGHDEGGIPRFIRDEVGANLSGAQLVLVAHERDTADGRLGLRFVDNPSQLRRETVLGRVLHAEPVMPGARITKATTEVPEEYRRTVCAPNLRGIPIVR